MVKFRTGNLVGFGLSEENIKRLREKKPIHIKLGEMIPNSQIEILIFAGKDELEMAKDLAPFLTSESNE